MYGHNGLEVSGGANFDRAPNLGRETRRRWPKAVSARICSTTVCRAGASGLLAIFHGRVAGVGSRSRSPIASSRRSRSLELSRLAVTADAADRAASESLPPTTPRTNPALTPAAQRR
jgi:hypothetical protein